MFTFQKVCSHVRRNGLEVNYIEEGFHCIDVKAYGKFLEVWRDTIIVTDSEGNFFTEVKTLEEAFNYLIETEADKINKV